MAPSPHDTLFRSIFGLPQHAAAELDAVLPRELAQRLDLGALTRVEGSFVDEALRASSSDLLFRARWRSGSSTRSAADAGNGQAHSAPGIEPLPPFADPYLYLLLEHQSSFDPRMPLRLLAYMTRIWERHAREHPDERLLPPIVPVVIHHGARPWRGSPRFRDHLLLPPGAPLPTTPPLLDFGFLLDDLTLGSDAELMARGNDAIARLTWLALRNGRDQDGFFPRLVAAIHALEGDLRGPAAPSALVALASYVCHVSDEPLASVRDAIAAAIAPEVRSPFMTIADQLKAEGRAEAQRESLVVVLEARFGPLDEADRARIAAAGSDQLLRWLHCCGVAPSVSRALEG